MVEDLAAAEAAREAKKKEKKARVPRKPSSPAVVAAPKVVHLLSSLHLLCSQLPCESSKT